jgi:membrane associated rhomboid family serine protease
MSLTNIIIGITVLTSIYGISNPVFQEKCIMNPYIVERKKEYYRFISSGFIHNGYIHLLFNMMTFYFFAPVVAEWYFVGYFGVEKGYLLFLLLYIGGIIVSDMPTFAKYKNLPYYNSLGASGGVSSVVLASIIYNPLSEIYIYGVLPIPGFILGGVYIIYSYYYSKGSDDNINHSAHLYGALYGIAFSLIIRPAALPEFVEKIASWQIFN